MEGGGEGGKEGGRRDGRGEEHTLCEFVRPRRVLECWEARESGV